MNRMDVEAEAALAGCHCANAMYKGVVDRTSRAVSQVVADTTQTDVMEETMDGRGEMPDDTTFGTLITMAEIRHG